MSTWILLRGLTRESRHWGRFPTLLRDATGAAQVVALDLPGNGRLCGQTSPIRVETMADECRTQLRRSDVQPPFFLLAMSLGAMVATSWAMRFTPEIRGCVLINTSMRPFCPFYRRLRPANYPSILRLLMLRGARASESLILHMTSRLRTGSESVLDEWSALRRECPVTRGNALRQLFAAARFRAPPGKPETRMLVLGSANDALVDVRCSRKLAEVWQCDYAEHPQAGHDLPLDDPEWVAGHVRAWAAGRPASDTALEPTSLAAPAGAGSPRSAPDPVA